MKPKCLTTMLPLTFLSAILVLIMAPLGIAIAGPQPKVTPNNQSPKVDPIMTEELMARLVKYTNVLEGSNTIPGQACKVLDLCDGTKDMKLRVAKSDDDDGIHYFALPVDADSKDILIVVSRDTLTELYLTDETGKLRAAAIYENKIAHLITNEKAAEKFKVEMALFAKEAAEQLPPTSAAGPNKN